ncbi:hypothetical protein DNI29_04375 [Hymenobacter sediminis]|uniref:hypothetical protein n=1 Tax=Hymenobacter sediminis TaxID=2218621 RepID=UPI000DA6916E|nr:hypothetical protein [Hymenobacter sediminis]RPD50039.1 hypothetical protein DNI29_04375 [Hymenobacter sediminis]
MSDNLITGNELAALVLAALPNAEKVTIVEIQDHGVVFDWAGYGFRYAQGETMRFHFTGKTAKEFIVWQYAKMSPQSRRPPCWTNATDLCTLMRALFRQRWTPYVRHELDTSLKVNEAEQVVSEAKVIQFTST